MALTGFRLHIKLDLARSVVVLALGKSINLENRLDPRLHIALPPLWPIGKMKLVPFDWANRPGCDA